MDSAKLNQTQRNLRSRKGYQVTIKGEGVNRVKHPAGRCGDSLPTPMSQARGLAKESSASIGVFSVLRRAACTDSRTLLP